MMANSVVLPAPFGPISAVIRPAGADSDAALTASKPAEAARHVLDRQAAAQPWAASRTCDATPRRRAKRSRTSANAPTRPRGAKQMTSIEHGAVDHEIEAGHVAGHELGALAERFDHQRADQRPEYGADAADDRRQQRLDRDPGAVGDAGIDEQEILHVEAAGGGSDRGGEHHGAELDRGRIDAERHGGILVLAHRDQPGAEARALDQPRNHQRDANEREDDIVKDRAALELERLRAADRA